MSRINTKEMKWIEKQLKKGAWRKGMPVNKKPLTQTQLKKNVVTFLSKPEKYVRAEKNLSKKQYENRRAFMYRVNKLL